jgi:predicted acylesterase/phospholipase RssA
MLILHCLTCNYGGYSRVAVKTALVLSAGGMFGAYQAGAWRELSTWFHPDLIVGTSAGALNGWLIAGGCTPQELIDLWTDPKTAEFLKLRPPLQRWRGFFDGVTFSERVQELYSRHKPRIPIGVVLTEVPRLVPRLFQNDEITWQHLAAACAIPMGLPPQRIGGRWYVDGGLLGALPLWPAPQMGAVRAIAVNALPFLPSPLMRAGVGALRRISPRGPSPGALDVVTIVPEGGLGTVSDAIRWSRDNILRMVERGSTDARRVIAGGWAGRDSAQRVLQ